MSEYAWMKVARSYLGIKEVVGPVDNPTIVAMFATVGHSWVKDDETAWCAAYVGHCLEKARITSTRALNARSYETWGQRLEEPLYGCVAVKERKGGAAWQGHTGFVVGANKAEIILIGGNQNNMVSIAAYPRNEFTAFRWVPGLDVPKLPRPLPTSVAGAVSQATEA